MKTIEDAIKVVEEEKEMNESFGKTMTAMQAVGEERFGPQPAGEVGPSVNTMQSPFYRLIDASPINKTAWRVGGFQKQTKKK